MLRVILSFILFVIISVHASAQMRVGYLEIRGTVVNQSNVPLEGATVLLVSSNKVKITEANGYFRTTLPKRDIILVISHVGYETHYETILINDPRITQEGLLEITFKLKEKANILKPVDIYGKSISKKPEVVHSVALNYVLDFNFFDDFLIMLVRKEGNKYLQKRHLYYDTLIYEKQVGIEFDSIYKDCLGNLHLLSKKHAMQFFPLTDNFLLYEKQPNVLFNRIVRPCVEYYNSNYVFYIHSAHNQSTDYFSYLADSSTYRYFVRILDELAFYYILDLADQQGRNVSAISFKDEGFGIVLPPPIAKEGFLKMMLKPVFGPLMRVKNQFFVFDPIKDSIFHFDERSMPLGASSMRFHKQKHWSKWIETDVDHQKIYTRFDIRGQYYFSEVNPYSGELINRYELFENYYPEHLKIKDGAAYYIKMVDKRRVLYRQPLEVNVTGTVEN